MMRSSPTSESGSRWAHPIPALTTTVKAARSPPRSISKKVGRFWAYQAPQQHNLSRTFPLTPGREPRSTVSSIRGLAGRAARARRRCRSQRPCCAACFSTSSALPPTPATGRGIHQGLCGDPQAALVKVGRPSTLLASPQFGERWGRHWLDVARYSESNGKDVNVLYPESWRYRDYVIGSFNKTSPTTCFLTEQIAGDLMSSSDDSTNAPNRSSPPAFSPWDRRA